MSAEEDLEPYRMLKDRDLAAEGLFIAEGPILVERVLASGSSLQSVLCVPSVAARIQALCAGRCPVYVRRAEEMSDVVGFAFHRGVLACGLRPPRAGLEQIASWGIGKKRSLLVLCPDLNDDANLGSILRSAVAFGAAGVLLGPRCCDALSRRALRSSMGASLLGPIARYESEEGAAAALRAAGYALYGAANRPEALRPAQIDPPRRLALAIGNEGSGLDAAWLSRCDVLVRIPMSSRLDSLNAGVAAGILLYALGGGDDP